MKKLLTLALGCVMGFAAWGQVPTCEKEISAANALDPDVNGKQRSSMRAQSIERLQELLETARRRSLDNPFVALAKCNLEREILMRNQSTVASNDADITPPRPFNNVKRAR